MTDSPNPFRVVLRGYDPGQVDRRVYELETDLDSAREQTQALEARVRRLEQDLAHAAQERPEPLEQEPAEPATFTHLGDRVGQILTLAEAEAEELRARARNEAASYRDQAEEAVAGIRSDVDRYAEQRRSDAEIEAARILEDARRTADDRLDAAERDAAARLQEAEAVYENQRAKAAKAAADFETTLARRRQMAEDEFKQQMEDAQQRLEELERHIERSRAESESAHTDSLRESRRLVEEAEQQAAAIVNDAKTVAARVRADSERELFAATQRRDSINAQLANVRQMLTTLTGVAPSALMDHAMGEEAAPAPASPDLMPVDAPAGEALDAEAPQQEAGDELDGGAEHDGESEPDSAGEHGSDTDADHEARGDEHRYDMDEAIEEAFTPMSPPRIG